MKAEGRTEGGDIDMERRTRGKSKWWVNKGWNASDDCDCVLWQGVPHHLLSRLKVQLLK